MVVDRLVIIVSLGVHDSGGKNLRKNVSKYKNNFSRAYSESLQVETFIYFQFFFKIFTCFRIKIIDPREKHPSTSQAVGRLSNVLYLLWAICGGFILHFLLSNFLTVLLRPTFPKAVETAEDVLEKGLIPFGHWEGEYLREIFEYSPDPAYREIAKQLIIPDNWHQWAMMVSQMKYPWAMSAWNGGRDYTHLVPYDKNAPETIIQMSPATVQIGYLPRSDTIKWFFIYQRSSAPVPGVYPYKGHLANKKWPLKKVFFRKHLFKYNDASCLYSSLEI